MKLKSLASAFNHATLLLGVTFSPDIHCGGTALPRISRSIAPALHGLIRKKSGEKVVGTGTRAFTLCTQGQKPSDTEENIKVTETHKTKIAYGVVVTAGGKWGGKKRLDLCEKPAYIWIEKNHLLGQEYAGAFSPGKHSPILNLPFAHILNWFRWHNPMNTLAPNPYGDNRWINVTEILADKVISMGDFNQIHPITAKKFQEVLQSEVGHPSNAITYWKPSQKLLQLFRQKGTLVNKEYLCILEKSFITCTVPF